MLQQFQESDASTQREQQHRYKEHAQTNEQVETKTTKASFSSSRIGPDSIMAAAAAAAATTQNQPPTPLIPSQTSIYQHHNSHSKNLSSHLSSSSKFSPSKHLAPAPLHSHHNALSGNSASHGQQQSHNKGHARRQSVARLLPEISKLRLLSWLVEASNELINCDIAIMDGVYAKLNKSRESSSNLFLTSNGNNSNKLLFKQTPTTTSVQHQQHQHHQQSSQHQNRYSLVQIQNIMNSRPSSCRLPSRVAATNTTNSSNNRLSGPGSLHQQQQQVCKNNNNKTAPLIGINNNNNNNNENNNNASKSSDAIIIRKQQHQLFTNDSNSPMAAHANANSNSGLLETGASGPTTEASQNIIIARQSQANDEAPLLPNNKNNQNDHDEKLEKQLVVSSEILPLAGADDACDKVTTSRPSDQEVKDKDESELLVSCEQDACCVDADKHQVATTTETIIGTNCDQANKKQDNNSDNKTDDIKRATPSDETETTSCQNNTSDVCDITIKSLHDGEASNVGRQLNSLLENVEAGKLERANQEKQDEHNCRDNGNEGVKLSQAASEKSLPIICNEGDSETPAQQTSLAATTSSSLPANCKLANEEEAAERGDAEDEQVRRRLNGEPLGLEQHRRPIDAEHEDEDEDEEDEDADEDDENSSTTTTASSETSSGIHGGATSLTLSSSGSNSCASGDDSSSSDQDHSQQPLSIRGSSAMGLAAATSKKNSSNELFAQRLSHAALISQAAAEAAAASAAASASMAASLGPTSLPVAPPLSRRATTMQTTTTNCNRLANQAHFLSSRSDSLSASNSSLLLNKQQQVKSLQLHHSARPSLYNNTSNQPSASTQNRSSAEILSEKVRKSLMEHNHLQTLLVNVIRHYDRLRLLQAQQRRRFYNSNTSANSDELELPVVLQKRIDLVEITRLLDDACLCHCHSNQLANVELINSKISEDLPEKSEPSSLTSIASTGTSTTCEVATTTRKNKQQQQAPVPVPARKLRRFKKLATPDSTTSSQNADCATSNSDSALLAGSGSPTLTERERTLLGSDTESAKATRDDIIRQMPDKLCASCFDTHYWLYPCLVMDLQQTASELSMNCEQTTTTCESLVILASPPKFMHGPNSGPSSLIDLHDYHRDSSDHDQPTASGKSGKELISEINNEILKRNATFLKLVQQRVSATIRESLNLIELIRKEIKSPESIKKKQLMRCFSASIQLLSSVGNYVVSAQDIPTFIPDLGQSNSQNTKIFRLPQSDFDQQHQQTRLTAKSQLDRSPLASYGIAFNQHHHDHYIRHDSAGSLRLVDSDYHLAAAPEIPIRRKFNKNHQHIMPYARSGDLHSLRSVSIISSSSNDFQTSSGPNSICSDSMISVRTNMSGATCQQQGQTSSAALQQHQQYQNINNLSAMDQQAASQATANLQQQKLKQLSESGRLSEASSSGNSSTNSSASSSIARGDVQQSCLSRLRNNNYISGGYGSPAARRPTYTIANDMNLTTNQNARNDLLWSSFEGRYGSLNSPLSSSSSSRGKTTIDDIDLLDAVAAHESNRKFWQSPKFNFIKKLLRVKEQRLLRQQSKDRRIYNNKVQNKFRLVMMDLSHFNKSQQLLTTENGVNSLLTSMRHVLEFGLFLTVKLY